MKRRWLLASVAALMISTFVVYGQVSRDDSDFLENPTARALVQTYSALTSEYLNDVDREAVLQGAITGMLDALDDPFSYYLKPKDAAREIQDRSGSFEGIGAVLTTRNRQTGKGVEILNVYQGGPAAGAGVQRGDIFVEVDGVDVRDATTTEVVDLVRGPGGTPVEITFRRPGVEDLVTFEIVRDTIEIVNVSSAMLPDDVGYVNLRSFGATNVYDQMVEQIAELRADGARALVLDLRDNGGGLLSQGVLIADEFLTEGDIVLQRARGVTRLYASADAQALELPMVVLVNENSASASEIVAGALQENGRALVVGEETFGKGVAQSVVQLSDGGQLAYTSFEWLTPDRRSIADEGIVPDVYAEDTRFPDVISVEGQGADPGSSIGIVVDGEEVGSTVADEDGEFSFVTTGPRPQVSEVQGEAIVDIENDAALRTALDTLLEQIAAGTN